MDDARGEWSASEVVRRIRRRASIPGAVDGLARVGARADLVVRGDVPRDVGAVGRCAEGVVLALVAVVELRPAEHAPVHGRDGRALRGRHGDEFGIALLGELVLVRVLRATDLVFGQLVCHRSSSRFSRPAVSSETRSTARTTEAMARVSASTAERTSLIWFSVSDKLRPQYAAIASVASLRSRRALSSGAPTVAVLMAIGQSSP